MDYTNLKRMDFRHFPIILALMWISLLINSAMTGNPDSSTFLTPTVKSQIQWFVIGWISYFFMAAFDYRKLISHCWFLYVIAIILLIGLFFASPIQNVHRWYRIPFWGREFQPSEYTKLAVIIALSSFLQGKEKWTPSLKTALQALTIVGLPFFLILKQPDLGTALILYPIATTIFYLGGVHRRLVLIMTLIGGGVLLIIGALFIDLLPHAKLYPFASHFLKEYQYERLNPNNYHQRASQTAIGIGGWTGCGWHKSTFSGREWLPAAHTDSAFASYAEEFGLVGIFCLFLLFFGLIYFGFQVTAKAKDTFGRLVSAGITVCLASHIIINIGMMCGCLPITGVPLVLITYGGSSAVFTMAALGILQSIYSRRFTF